MRSIGAGDRQGDGLGLRPGPAAWGPARRAPARCRRPARWPPTNATESATPWRTPADTIQPATTGAIRLAPNAAEMKPGQGHADLDGRQEPVRAVHERAQPRAPARVGLDEPVDLALPQRDQGGLRRGEEAPDQREDQDDREGPTQLAHSAGKCTARASPRAADSAPRGRPAGARLAGAGGSRSDSHRAARHRVPLFHECREAHPESLDAGPRATDLRRVQRPGLEDGLDPGGVAKASPPKAGRQGRVGQGGSPRHGAQGEPPRAGHERRAQPRQLSQGQPGTPGAEHGGSRSHTDPRPRTGPPQRPGAAALQLRPTAPTAATPPPRRPARPGEPARAAPGRRHPPPHPARAPRSRSPRPPAPRSGGPGRAGRPRAGPPVARATSGPPRPRGRPATPPSRRCSPTTPPDRRTREAPTAHLPLDGTPVPAAHGPPDHHHPDHAPGVPAGRGRGPRRRLGDRRPGLARRLVGHRDGHRDHDAGRRRRPRDLARRSPPSSLTPAWPRWPSGAAPCARSAPRR